MQQTTVTQAAGVSQPDAASLTAAAPLSIKEEDLNGLMLPVQALTAGFVHEVLPLSVPVVSDAVPTSLTQSSLTARPLPIVHHSAAQTIGAVDAPIASAHADMQFNPLGQLGVQNLPSDLTATTALQASAVQPVSDMASFASSVAAAVEAGGQGHSAASSVAAAPGLETDATSHQGMLIGGTGIMLSYEDSSELTEVPELYYLPNAPVWVLGLANLHGNLVPVFDLAAYLGVEQNTGAASDSRAWGAGSEKSMLLVLGHGADAAGVIIDGIPQRLTPSKQYLTDADTAPATLMPHIQAAYFINNQLWFDLDCDSLLNALEQAVMQTVQ